MFKEPYAANVDVIYIVVGTQAVYTVNVLLKYLFVKYIFKVYCFVRLVPVASLRFFGNLAENYCNSFH